MQQFQSLQRLMIFYILTLLVMLSLYYFTLFHEMQEHSEQHSIDSFYLLQHKVTEDVDPLNSEIQKILEQPFFEGISYQVVFMMPSGQTYVYRYTRPNERAFANVTFPTVDTALPSTSRNDSAYTLTSRDLMGTIELESGHKLHIVMRHKPLNVNWVSYRYWLPLMTAIVFFTIALLYMLKRRANWEQLFQYADNLSSNAKEAYTPPPFIERKSTDDFLHLGHALGRISYQLHHDYRRVKTLKHRLDRLIDQSPLPMLMLMRHGQISFFNPRFGQVFIHSPKDEGSYELTDFFAGTDEPTQQLLRSLSQLRVSRTLTVIGLENTHTYQLHITPWFGEHGQIHGFTVLLNSIHELTHQIETLHSHSRQQQIELDEFRSIRSVMGHKLRVPLEAMIDILEPIVPETLTAEQNDILNTLIKTSQSMLTTLNDTLDIGDIEVRKTRLSIASVDIYKLGQTVNDLVIDKARQQGLELIYFFAPDCPRYIDTDAVRLRQILLNLLNNAVVLTPSGYIAFTIKTVNQQYISQIDKSHLLPASETMTTKPSTHWIQFSVQDTGTSVYPTRQAQLLACFQQNDRHASEQNEQTNQPPDETVLALNTANSFAHLLGGFIELKSTVNNGSTFNLYLPCCHPNYQPVYYRSQQLAHIHLIAMVHQPLVAEHLQCLSEHLSISTSIYTSPDVFVIQQLTKNLAQSLQGFAPILLLDYDYYESQINVIPHESAADDSMDNAQITSHADKTHALHHLLTDTALPKILFSMKPERRIPSIILDQCNGFLAKPLNKALLLSELMRLTLPVRQKLTATPSHAVTIDQSDSQLDSKSSVSPLILVVEDSLTNQKIACKILSKLGYRSVVAEDGQQALKQLMNQRQDISLILMDCRMPVMDGLQATQAIRAQGDDIPIVALTANNTDEDRDACMQVGMNEFLSKPINKEELEAVLHSFI